MGGILQLFGFMIMFCLYVLLYSFIGAVAIVLLVFKGIQLLYRHRQAKKHAAQEADALADPPMPVVNRVK